MLSYLSMSTILTLSEKWGKGEGDGSLSQMFGIRIHVKEPAVVCALALAWQGMEAASPAGLVSSEFS